MDVVDAVTRSRMMAGIRTKNTRPEIRVRKALHGLGLRFARSDWGLPGKPDLVLPRWKVAVFVHGCFWHWHGCQLSKLPESNRDFWWTKLARNKERDTHSTNLLLKSGWRVAIIWECAIRGKDAESRFAGRMNGLARWIRDEFSQDTYVMSGIQTVQNSI